MKENIFNIYILPVIRFINWVSVSIFLLFFGTHSDNQYNLTFDVLFWSIVFGLSPIIAIMIKNNIESKTEFLEWDKRERKNNRVFLRIITLVVFFFSYLSVFFLTLFFYEFKNFEKNELSRIFSTEHILLLFFGLLFLANSIFTVPLHYRLYESYLLFDHRQIVDKPKSWDYEPDDSE